MGRNRIIGIAIASVVFAAVVSVMLPKNIITTAQAIEITLLFVLAPVTTIYAKRTSDIADATKKQAKEMKEQRYAALKPIIDIQTQEESGVDIARKEIAVLKGELPQALPCKLRDVGPGPAIDLHSFIEYPIGKRSQWDFGTLATGDQMMPLAPLVIERSDDQGFLVVYYKDVYDRSFKSRREVSVSKEKNRPEIGPLKIRKLSKEE